MKYSLIYKFTYASCSSGYIDKTCRNFKTKAEEHMKKNIKCHIFKHFHCNTSCLDLHNCLSIKMIYKTNYKLDLKLKLALYIYWKKYTWPKDRKSFSLHPFFIILRSLFAFFPLLFYFFNLSFSWLLTQIIGILYLLLDNWLWLYLMTMHLANRLYNNFVSDLCHWQLLWFV